MLKNLLLLLVAAPTFALNLGEICTDDKGNAYMVVLCTADGDFVRELNLREIGKLEHYFDTELANGQKAALTVPNHNPFVSGRSKLGRCEKRAALVRIKERGCLGRQRTVVKAVTLAHDEPAAERTTNPVAACFEDFPLANEDL